MKTINTQCCIAGGGPAGIILGYLLARAGVDVVILEKYPDFFRDFRGDTIHPSTMGILDELGLLQQFLKLPHNKTDNVSVHINDEEVTIADFTHLKGVPAFLGFVPQWDFLNFIAREGKKYPHFHLLMKTEVTDILYEDGSIHGVIAKDNHDICEIRSKLVIGADGRHSIIREKAHLKAIKLGAPIDVLWFRLSRKTDHKNSSLGYATKGGMMILLDRDDYWQCAYIIRKGEFEHIKKKGIAQFRSSVAEVSPLLKDTVLELKTFDDVKLLSVTVDALPQWYLPNLVCIGDAAHAMSPVGGVGINLAIQDAVAAANILAQAFRDKGKIQLSDLEAIQKRRAWPSHLIQKGQVFIHTHIIIPTLTTTNRLHIPWQIRLFSFIPYLRRIPAWIVGVGVRPEHISELIRNGKK